MEVAIKTLNADHMNQGKDEFLREAKVMMNLHHPCIVKLIGICEGPPIMLVCYTLCYYILNTTCSCSFKSWCFGHYIFFTA